jgi:hypothetical protein
MNVALGMKAHPGWAALVVIGMRDGAFEVADRRRIELVDEDWARQPYHAAEHLDGEEAHHVVRRGVKAAHRIAAREMEVAVRRARELGFAIAACSVLVVGSMPDWTVEEILSVHFRMHKAEGVLFRDALVNAAGSCGLTVVEVPEKGLAQQAAQALRMPEARVTRLLASMGKPIGPPWGKDQKEAALAAMVALRRHSR